MFPYETLALRVLDPAGQQARFTERVTGLGLAREQLDRLGERADPLVRLRAGRIGSPLRPRRYWGSRLSCGLWACYFSGSSWVLAPTRRRERAQRRGRGHLDASTARQHKRRAPLGQQEPANPIPTARGSSLRIESVSAILTASRSWPVGAALGPFPRAES